MYQILCTSSLWIAFALAFGPVVLSRLYAVGEDYIYIAYLATFLVTFAVYSLDKVSGSKEDLLNTPERAWLAAYPIKQIALAAYLAAIVLVVATDFYKLPAILVFGFAGWIYTRKICGRRPKDIPGMKNIIVAFATAACYGGLIGAPLAGYVLIFLLIFVGTAIFDLRDQVGDAVSGVRTLPVVLGTSRTVTLLAIVAIAAMLLSPIAGGVALLEVLYFSTKRPNWQYDFLCDAWFVWMFIVIESIIYLRIVL